jgi:hypothetical protein
MILQPGYSVTRNEEGGFSAVATYYVISDLAKDIINILPPGRPITSFDSGQIGIDYPFLAVSSVSIEFEEAGVTAIRINYSGGASEQYDEEELTGSIGGGGGGGAPPESSPEIPVPVYRIEARIVEVPFSDHPKFRALSDVDKTVLGKLIIGDFEIDPLGDKVGYYDQVSDAWRYFKSGGSIYTLTGNALRFAELITQGQTSYRGASISYIETTQGASPMTPAQLRKLGKISNPRGNPPSVGDRNWMLVSASQEQRGALYQTSIEWELAPNDDGFDQFLYQ